MEEKSGKVIRVMEIDDMPYLDSSTAKLIGEKDLAFEWGGRLFKVRRVGVNRWDVCECCQLSFMCDKEIERICQAFDDHLGGWHMLELIDGVEGFDG